MTSNVKVVLRNYQTQELIDYNMEVFDSELAKDWIPELKKLLSNNLFLEKNYCFLGFPKTQRNLQFLCDAMNKEIAVINSEENQKTWEDAGIGTYVIEEYFSPETVIFPDSGQAYTEEDYANNKNPDLLLSMQLKHNIMNVIHNHFERLQGTVNNIGLHYLHASDNVKWAIRQLNILCHEIESYCLSQRKFKYDPMWVRPSQITTWLAAPRSILKPEHRKLFNANKYDKEFGGVYMHWCQIGKTLFEVWRDENAPVLDKKTTCEAINELEYYSGEFDVDWGNSITEANAPWHKAEQDKFKGWLVENGLDPNDHASMSLGYLPIGQVKLQESFGTSNFKDVITTLGNFLDIYSIEVDGVSNTFPYHWADTNWKELQIKALEPGYRFSSKNV